MHQLFPENWTEPCGSILNTCQTIRKEVRMTNKAVRAQLDRISSGEYDEVDVRFTDILGYWRHMTIPVSAVGESLFKRGLGFDGSTLRGMTKTEAGDLCLRPDPRRTFADPFSEQRTLAIIADIVHPDTGKSFAKDPRGVARRAFRRLRASGVATDSFWAPEFEFYLFDKASFWAGPGRHGYDLRSIEAPGNAEDHETMGLVHADNSGYNMMYPVDSQHDIRSEIVRRMQEAGIQVKYHHHEVGRMGQNEVEVGFSSFLSAADNSMLTKHIVRNVALRHGLASTFMPKPLCGEPGSGMHFHIFMTDGEKRIFYDADAYCNLSSSARSAIAGILHHAPALCAFTNPTVNSYRRLIPGQEAPVYRFFSGPNRSAAIRVPGYARTADSMRFEYRVPDASANPYLSMSAILMAAIDGMKNDMDPTEMGYGPIDENVFKNDYNTDDLAVLPGALENALDALENDSDFLEEGGVFAPELICDYIAIKRAEVARFRGNPHPMEHVLYFNL